MIIALAGRRIDAPDAKAIRFPLTNVEKVKKELTKFFISSRPVALVCSGACGADLLALLVAGDLRIQRKMVLPFEAARFRSTSVTDRPGDWGILFDEISEKVNEEGGLIILNYPVDDKDAYEKTNSEILNQAENLAKQFNSEKDVTEVIVWEGGPKEKNDVTNHFMQEGLKRGFAIKEIKTLNY
jgi:hypothetical protein